MNIIFMGPPAAGKGTYASLIKEDFKIPHISTGDLFRAIALENTPLADEVRSYIDNGLLVPDELTIKLVIERLGKADCKNGFILDGFPRTLNQAIELDKALKNLNMKIDKVIDLDVDFELIRKRITGRRSCSKCNKVYNIYTMPSKKGDICEECGGSLYQRKDDNDESIKVRYQTFLNQTRAAVDYYKKQNILVNIKGDNSLDKVYPLIKKVLKGE